MSKYEEKPKRENEWLKASEHMDFAMQVCIQKVTDELCKDFNTQEEVYKTGLWINSSELEGIILLSPSNKMACQAKWQDTDETEDWKGRDVFLSTKEYKMENGITYGWIVVPLALPAQQEMDFDDEIPFGKESAG